MFLTRRRMRWRMFTNYWIVCSLKDFQVYFFDFFFKSQVLLWLFFDFVKQSSLFFFLSWLDHDCKMNFWCITLYWGGYFIIFLPCHLVISRIHYVVNARPLLCWKGYFYVLDFRIVNSFFKFRGFIYFSLYCLYLFLWFVYFIFVWRKVIWWSGHMKKQS